jgi:hypothetical protein
MIGPGGLLRPFMTFDPGVQFRARRLGGWFPRVATQVATRVATQVATLGGILLSLRDNRNHHKQPYLRAILVTALRRTGGIFCLVVQHH